MSETMGFGKHKGQLVSLVPTDYLVWCAEIMAAPPKVVVAELERRASRHGTKDAAAAAGAVSTLAWRRAQPKKKQGGKRRPKKVKPQLSKEERRAESQRVKAAERLDRVQSQPVVGEDFDRLRLAFAQADGCEEDCPFDTPDEPYTGPSLSYSGGRWSISPSEFPAVFS